jgi:hypothetical protein
MAMSQLAARRPIRRAARATKLIEGHCGETAIKRPLEQSAGGPRFAAQAHLPFIFSFFHFFVIFHLQSPGTVFNLTFRIPWILPQSP